MKSCIYEGQVRHGRRKPVEHAFRYRVFMMYLDLDELEDVFRGRWFWSTRRRALARFRRSDHLGDPSGSLKEAVLDLVERETDSRPEGPVRLLTNLSYFGFCFNPVSFYYCFAGDGETLETIVAEVNNTPWGERDTYVLPLEPLPPPLPADQNVTFVLKGTGDLYIDGERVFTASLKLRRRAITTRSLARVLLVYPFMTFKVLGGIYWQAMRLWWKRTPFYGHPARRKPMVTQ